MKRALEWLTFNKYGLNMWNTNQISTSIVINILINISEVGRMKKNVIRHACDIIFLQYIMICYLTTYICEFERNI